MRLADDVGDAILREAVECRRRRGLRARWHGAGAGATSQALAKRCQSAWHSCKGGRDKTELELVLHNALFSAVKALVQKLYKQCGECRRRQRVGHVRRAG